MQSTTLSLRDSASVPKRDDLVAFWTKRMVGDPLENTYQPVWQTSDWGRFLIESGQASDVVFFGTYENYTLVAYGFGEVRTVGMGFSAMFFVGGPHFLENTEPAMRTFLANVESYAKSKGLAFVLFEGLSPLLGTGLMDFSGQTKYLLEPTTRIVRLDATPDSILADMKQKGRYNIKLAEKSGVTAVRAEFTEANLDTFYSLLSETTSRDGFSGNSKSYYRHLLASRKHPSEGLYFAWWQGRVIAAAILTIEDSTAVYYYGASSSDPEVRKAMAPYALQWAMMLASRAAGCRYYDFLGIAPEGSENHHLQGVTDFKSKFGGEIVVWPKKRLFVTHTWKYLAYRIFRMLKSAIKK